MIGNKTDPVFIKDLLYAHLTENIDGRRRRNIIPEYQIKFCLDQITGFDLGKPRMISEYFGCHSHSHI